MGKIWLEIFSDLFVNLSAGWVGAIFVSIISPVRMSKKKRVKLLTVNAVSIILSLALAYWLRLKIWQ
ncbi:MAG: hypothetical protein G01um101416_868 [Microgenomates group bacterium Gr01-1014_16]|nr:MAG: hypothetical protein G01um101416_868 [Microgenomates group bacterium Gr01-1014_16]